jgi:hypothetical protein
MTEQGGEWQCTFRHHHDSEKSVGKVPIIGLDWPHARLTRQEVEWWLKRYPTANWGLLLEPSGLLVIDPDSKEAELECSERGLPPGPQTKTGRSVHHYYHNPKGIIGATTRQGDSGTIDVLSQGIVIIPGSRHRSGVLYEHLVSFEDWPLEDPPLWAEEWLLASIKAKAEVEALPDDLKPIIVSDLILPSWVKELIVTGKNSYSSNYPSRSEALYAVLMQLIRARYDTETIASVLLDPRNKISEKPREQGRKWLASDIARARAKQREQSQEKTAPPGGGDTQQTDNLLPEIQVNARPLRNVTHDSIDALAKQNNPPITFVRDGTLVRVQRNERGQASIVALNEHGVRGLITRSAEYLKKTHSEKKGWVSTHVSPPLDVVRDIMALGSWPDFSPLSAVTETPILLYDGSLVDSTGYDAVTCLYYDPAPGLVVPPVPSHPTPADIADARAFLETDLLVDFPFCGEPDKANTEGMFLTPIIRQTFCDVAPLGIIDKPQGGTGGSLIADILGVTHVGDQRGMMGAPVEEEEWRKQISTVLSAGTTLIVIDNVEHSLGAPALERAITSTTWKDRALGSNKEIRLPQRATWVATGNNIRLRRSMQRRCYWIRMDAKMARPWQRKQFRHPELVKWVQENRGKILHALLTLVRAWVAAGKPDAKVPTIGGFDSWARTIGGILEYAGIKGFLGNLEEMYQMADEESEEWEAFLRRWYEIFGDVAQPVSVVVKHIRDEVGVEGALSDVLPDDISSIPERTVDGKPVSIEKRLGKALSKKLGVRYGDDGIHLEKTGEGKKAKLWCVKLSDLSSNQGV